MKLKDGDEDNGGLWYGAIYGGDENGGGYVFV